MDWRPGWLMSMALAAGGLSGCSDAVTIHPMSSYLDPSADVPPVAGRWIANDDRGGVAVLQVDGAPEDRARCREVTVRYLEGSDDTLVGNQVCFFELNGHLVAELEIGEPYEVYRQFLVKVSEERIEACSLWPIWVMLDQLSEDRPTGYSLDALEYTERERGDSTLMVFIAKPKEMRAFLEVALPELASACDTGGEGFEWNAFERAPPEGAPAEDED